MVSVQYDMAFTQDVGIVADVKKCYQAIPSKCTFQCKNLSLRIHKTKMHHINKHTFSFCFSFRCGL